MTSLGALLAEGAELLTAAGVAEAELEARALLSHVLDWSLNQPLLRGQDTLSPEQALIVRHLLDLRARRMPLQYVTRSAEFCGLRLRADPRALIPRPETELLAEAMAERLATLNGPQCLVDVGCGTGALGLGIRKLMEQTAPLACLLLTDLSPEALALARENVELTKLAGETQLLQGSYLEPLIRDIGRGSGSGSGLESPSHHEGRPEGVASRVTALVSNPPYVRPEEMPGLAPEVLAEPRLALEAPSEDGLAAYRTLAEQMPFLPHLRLAGFETGYDQAGAVAEIMRPLGEVEILCDYSRIERMVILHVR